MPHYSYVCDTCATDFTVVKSMNDAERHETCPECNTEARRVYDAAIHGTRDSFGFRNAFRDKTTGQTIDTWSKWEKAGYSDLNETIQSMPDKRGQKNFIQQRIKEKTDMIERKAGKKLTVGGVK